MGKKDFFLEPDDAQTFGDINYMRMSKKVRKTFPKTLKNPDGFAIEKSISAEKVSKFSDANSTYQAKSTSSNYQPPSFNAAPVNTSPVTERSPKAESKPFSAPEPKPSPTPEPRKPDNSMDMFRNMAKNIRKGK